MPVPSLEPSNGRIRFGAAAVGLTCPAALVPWFPGLVDAAGERPAGRGVEILDLGGGQFGIAMRGGKLSAPLGFGDALASAWERITSLLCDGLTGAAALHAAAVSRGEDDVVLMPGGSGAGKTHLALWYRAQGFTLGTDELVAIEGGTSLAVSALGRPVMLKADAVLDDLLGHQDDDVAEVASAAGRLVSLGGGWLSLRPRRVFLVFPRFSAGASLSLRPLTQAEAALRLMASCVNARNLPQRGLGLAGAIARSSPAVDLIYGDAHQLDGSLDALTDRALSSPIGYDELAAFCTRLECRPVRAAPTALAAPAVLAPPRRLTVGMATYDDYDGAYFTVQAIRTYYPELRDDIEFVIVDNNPAGVCAEPLRRLADATDRGRYVPRGEWTSTAIRNAVFEEASSPCVVCVDSHVLLAPGALGTVLALLESGEHSLDLIQGPLVHDDLKTLATHMDPVWRGGMYGIWGDDPRGSDPDGPAFDIPMQGMGVFACRRDAWAGFNPRFRGFGGEEFYIHEKTRQRGGRTLCLPRLRWLHRFNRPFGVPYPNRWEDRIRNYVIGFGELGLGMEEMEAHFAELLGPDVAARIFAEARFTSRTQDIHEQVS